MIQNDCSYELLHGYVYPPMHHHTLLAQLVLTIAFGKITNTLVKFFQKNSQRGKNLFFVKTNGTFICFFG